MGRDLQINTGRMGRRILLALNETSASAPTPAPTTEITRAPTHGKGMFNPTLAIAVSTIIIFFFLVGFLTGYFKRYIITPEEAAAAARENESRRRRRANRLGKPEEKGLDPEVVCSMPLVKYRDLQQVGPFAEDCAVCLAVFEGSDHLRILPKCGHGFHSECIGEWFKSHSTCPLCRNSLVKLEEKIAAGRSLDDAGDVEQGGIREAPEFDVVEVVIRSDSSAEDDAALSGFSHEITEVAPTRGEGEEGSGALFKRTIRIGAMPGARVSIRRSSSVSSGLQRRQYVVDSEGTQHSGLGFRAKIPEREHAPALSGTSAGTTPMTDNEGPMTEKEGPMTERVGPMAETDGTHHQSS